MEREKRIGRKQSENHCFDSCKRHSPLLLFLMLSHGRGSMGIAVQRQDYKILLFVAHQVDFHHWWYILSKQHFKSQCTCTNTSLWAIKGHFLETFTVMTCKTISEWFPTYSFFFLTPMPQPIVRHHKCKYLCLKSNAGSVTGVCFVFLNAEQVDCVAEATKSKAFTQNFVVVGCCWARVVRCVWDLDQNL